MPPRIPLPKVLALGLVACAAAPHFSHAQTADRKTAIGINVSAMQYKGNYGSDYWDWSENKYAPGITFSRYISKGLDVQLSGNYVELKKDTPAGAPFFGSNFATNVVNVNLGLKFKAFKEESKIRPYLLAAPGLTYTSREGTFNRNGVSTNIANDKNHFDLFGAAGIDFRLGDAVTLFVQTGQHIPLNANIDGDPVRDDNKFDDRFLQHTVGLNVALGKAKDTDGDGVPDRKDKCPDTPSGVAVDENGCPLDGDKDGVPDYQDQCPTEAGTAAMQGCPDRDNDGVADKDDQCPDQAGLPALRGCPDADGDGVADAADKCPDTPKGTQVDANGCPLVVDADGDGIPDSADKCPDTPRGAKVDANGCPMEIDPGVRKLEQPVRFETNSTVIKRTSYGTLDKMVKALKEHPEYSLRVIGHADSRGTDEYNQALSERRAGSVKRYFTGKQVDPARVVTEGRGESEPAAPNTSAAGMSQNRRVEFKFEFFIPTAPQP